MPDPHPPPLSQPPTVFLYLPDRPDLAERIAGVLETQPGWVTATPDEPPDVRSADLVISRWPKALAELGVGGAGAGDGAVPYIGLIVLGPAAPTADAVLPLDFTDRELLLACRLVLDVVRLRRRVLDVERRREENARLAAADPLTGLANRRAWDAEAADRCRRAQAAGQAVCLAIFDVDRFKAVNEVQGYTSGDAVLAAIGHELAAALRAGDLLARLGGDEFAALLIGAFDSAAARAIVDRVRSAVGQHVTAEQGFEVSLSAGCAVAASGMAADLDELFASADTTLREAKRAGRDRTVPTA